MAYLDFSNGYDAGVLRCSIENNETKLVEQQTTWNGYNKIDFKLPDGAKYNQLQRK